MRITDVRIEKLKIHLVEPFKISIGVIEDFYTMLIKVFTDEGVYGIGEGSPMEIITGETIDGTLSAAQGIKEMLIGRDPFEIQAINAAMETRFLDNPSARAAYDLALYDICARSENLPLYKYLGASRNAIENDVTLAIDSLENMVARTKEYVAKGYSILKVKVGRSEEEDVESVAAIRAAAGSATRIFVDANQGWNKEQAPQIINRLAPYDVLFVEQPVPKNDMAGLAEVRAKSTVPIMADESVFNVADAKRAIQMQAADYVNIKLMKCGGISNALMINAICQEAGIKCVTGCMMDTSIGITAAASFSAAAENVMFGDLDSLSHIKDCGIPVGVTQNQDKLVLPEKPGLGIEIDL